MVSRSFRESVPSNVIILSDCCTVPTDYSLYSTYNGKYIKQVLNNCTNPGCCIGSSTHTHTCQSHTHPVCATAGHTHPLGTGLANAIGSGARTNGGASLIIQPSEQHAHPSAIASCISSAVNVCPSGNHNHGATNNDPSYRSHKFMQKSSVVSMRNKNIPFNKIIMWTIPNACIPSNFAIDCGNFSKLLGGVATDCTAPGSNLGNTNHTHSCAVHTHTLSTPTHFHPRIIPPGGVSEPAPPPSATQPSPPGSTFVSGTHGHSAGPASCPAAGFGTSPCDGHTHDTLTLDPAYKTIAFIKQTSIPMRRTGIPKDGLVLWACNLACIPTNLQLANGCNGTTNYLDKWVRSIPDACTNAGVCGGANTHTHNCIKSAHPGTTPVTHSHLGSGSTGTYSGLAGIGGIQGGAVPLSDTHTHTLGNTGSTNQPATINSEVAGHTHGSQCHKPNSKESGILQRL